MFQRLAIFFALPAALLAQDSWLSLSGSVVNSQTGMPLPHALVTVTGYFTGPPAPGQTRPTLVNQTALTDAGGAFRFSNLPANHSYGVRAQKPGFIADPQANQNRITSPQDNVRIGLSSLGVITGRVVDQNGEPMRGVEIHAMRANVEDGLLQTKTERTITTDSLGAYRLWNLSPGKYYLKAAGQGGGLLLSSESNLRPDLGDSFAPAYSSGGLTLDSAAPIEMGPAGTAKADFHLTLEPAWRIDGTLHNYTPGEKITFTAIAAGEEVTFAPDRFDAQTGVFQLKDVVNGSYILRAVQNDKAGEAFVNVNGRDAGQVELVLYPPIEIPVNVHFTNAPVALPKALLEMIPDLDEMRRQGDVPEAAETSCDVSLHAKPRIGGSTPESLFAKDDKLSNLSSGEYRFSVECANGYVRSALLGSQDLLADPVIRIQPGAAPPAIELLATHGGGFVMGSIGATPASLHQLLSQQVLLLLVPRSPGLNELLTQTVGEATEELFLPGPGAFAFGNLAPGSYTLYAFAKTDIRYRDPAFLKSLSGGQRITVEDDAVLKVTVNEVIP